MYYMYYIHTHTIEYNNFELNLCLTRSLFEARREKEFIVNYYRFSYFNNLIFQRYKGVKLKVKVILVYDSLPVNVYQMYIFD